MFIEEFILGDLSSKDAHFQIPKKKASEFAKRIADDFNPIHDIDAKRFCVPGDLLFACTLWHAGLHESMSVTFSDMVTDETPLHFKEDDSEQVVLVNEQGKTLLTLESAGECAASGENLEQLIRQYVAFSGTTFPHVLVPLWKQHDVMVNPARPLVIYASMKIELNTFDFVSPSLTLNNPFLELEGRRGVVHLPFTLQENGNTIGQGEKRMVLGSLKPYDQDAVDDLVKLYDDRKQRLAVS